MIPTWKQMHSPNDQNKAPIKHMDKWSNEIHQHSKTAKQGNCSLFNNQQDEKVTYRKITNHLSDKELIHEVYMKIPQLKSKTNNNIKDK